MNALSFLVAFVQDYGLGALLGTGLWLLGGFGALAYALARAVIE